MSADVLGWPWGKSSLGSILSVAPMVAHEVAVHSVYSVKKALASVAGVKRATVSIADKTAVVIYDDTQADVSVLAAASAKVGFPAAVKR